MYWNSPITIRPTDLKNSFYIPVLHDSNGSLSPSSHFQWDFWICRPESIMSGLPLVTFGKFCKTIPETLLKSILLTRTATVERICMSIVFALKVLPRWDVIWHQTLQKKTFLFESCLTNWFYATLYSRFTYMYFVKMSLKQTKMYQTSCPVRQAVTFYKTYTILRMPVVMYIEILYITFHLSRCLFVC